MAASILLLLAVGACGAPASEGVGSTTTQTPPPAPVTQERPEDEPAPRPTSPLAERTDSLGSALYDPAEHQARTRAPAGLSITGIGVTGAPVRPVGVEPNGEMEIPPAEEVGWYRFGAAPGEPGSSVLAAHIAYDGVDGVFRNLDRVAPGEEVVVDFDDGTSERYRVTEVVTHRKEALPADVFSRDGVERLVLITCGGDFNPSLRSYESNVVAYATPA